MRVLLLLLIFLSNNARALLPLLVKSGIKSENLSYVLADGKIKNADAPLTSSQAIKLYWICSSFKDFPQDYKNELRLIKTAEDSVLLEVPADLGIDEKEIWLLANEFSRTGLKEIKILNVYALPSAKGDQNLDKKLSGNFEFASQLKTELEKRGVKVGKIQETEQKDSASKTYLPRSILARVSLPSLAVSSRKALTRSQISSTEVASILARAFQKQNLEVPKSSPDFKNLNDCVAKVLTNFRTAPEFLTLLPAMTKTDGTSVRRLSSKESESYFLISVFQSNRNLKYAMISAKESPREPQKFEQDFPDFDFSQAVAE